MTSLTIGRSWPIMLAICTGGLLILGLTSLYSPSSSLSSSSLPFLPSLNLASQPRTQTEEVNILDGCHHVYLDMGSNIGIQIRKLYEPKHFPNAAILPIFDHYFGPPDSRRRPGAVCAVGWEPNPDHTPVLVKLEETYNACGWKVKIHTETGVGSRYREGHFKKIDYAKKGDGIGGQMRDSWSSGDDTTPAVTIRIAQFINSVVATRRLPRLEGPELTPAVVMKLDVEGKEMEVIPDLVMSGALAHLDTLHVDWHLIPDWQDKEARQTMEAIQFFTKLGNRMNLTHVTQVDSKDDESFGDFSGELPKC